MDDDVLFEVKKENLDTGLRGYPVGYCTTSTVNPTKGLFYAEYPITKLAYKEPESVIYLLYHGKEGIPSQIQAFSQDLARRSMCKPATIEQIQKLPHQGHPMRLYPCAILLAGLYEGINDYEEDCLNLIAKIPCITAYLINSHAGWGGCKPSRPELGYMRNFVEMLNVPHANSEDLNAALQLFNILHYDHGGGNLSTFVGKAVASGLEDMYGSIAAALCALAGPRHGRANQDCLEFVQTIQKELGDNPSEAELRTLLEKRLADNQLIFGFGHAVLRIEDPRAAVLFDFVKKKFSQHPLVRLVSLLRKVGPEVLKKNPKIADPFANVDLISGTMLTVCGFPFADYFTVLFGLARTVGIAIQIVYERCKAREGKGTPIIRPKYIYRGSINAAG